jgi:hypothetical protein
MTPIRTSVGNLNVMDEHRIAEIWNGHPSKTAKGGAADLVVRQRVGQPPWNFNVQAVGPTSVRQGRFDLTSSGAAGASLHVPSSNFWDPQHVWQTGSTNGVPTLEFTSHIDSANGNTFPFGTILHAFKDLFGNGSRNPCPQ